MSVTINVKVNGRSETVVGYGVYATRVQALEVVAKLLQEIKPTVQKVDKLGICDTSCTHGNGSSFRPSGYGLVCQDCGELLEGAQPKTPLSMAEVDMFLRKNQEIDATKAAHLRRERELREALQNLLGQIEQARDGFGIWPYEKSTSMEETLRAAHLVLKGEKR